MDIGLPGEDSLERHAVREWLERHPNPTGRELAEAGYVVPHWPRPFGLAAGPIDQLVIDEELRRTGVRRPINPIGIGWAGPTLLYAGSELQKERWIWPMISGEEIWCQLFSEPEAGSDLASLRTTAVRDGDAWVVNGQKVWTTIAHLAKYGILLARTDPTARKHRGISYFICPMDADGITVNPLVDMTGRHAFNEVFFDNVKIPGDHLVGSVGQGWELAKVTLGNERVSLSGEGALWGQGPTAEDLVDSVIRAGGPPDRVTRERLTQLWAEGRVLRILRLRGISAVLAGKSPGPEASVRKALADTHGREIMDLAKDLAGPYGTLNGTGPLTRLSQASSEGSVCVSDDSVGAVTQERAKADSTDSTWSDGFLFSPALTVGGGTAEVQRNIIAEKVLGLPRELDLS
ncbi:MAG: acyl-CoA dehydrogenase family protein [Acidimicrobiales bacterium]